MTFAHDHYDAASQVVRDGDVGISVRSLDGRLLEETRGRPASPTQPIGSVRAGEEGRGEDWVLMLEG